MSDEDIGRIPTAIPGLDELIEGGYPEGTVNLISGPAGRARHPSLPSPGTGRAVQHLRSRLLGV